MYYLAPLVRVTKARRSLRAPVGYGETETSWVIIGDQAILWARDAINDRRLQALAEGREEKLALATRSALSERIKDREFRSADSFVDTIAALLRAPGQNPWAALRPSKRRSRYEILLGPREDRLFWVQGVAPRKNTVVYTDNFTGNGNLDGRNFSGGGSQWDVLDGSMATSGGVLQTNNIPVDTYAQAVALADADTDELFAQVTQTVWSINAGNRYMESNLGVATNDDLTAGYFMFRVESNLDGNETGIFAVASEDLVDDNNPEFVQTGTIRIERDGSTIRGYVDDEEILSGTHTGEPTGTGFRKGALQSYAGWVSTNDLAWDNFSYGDLETGGGDTELVVADATHGHSADSVGLVQAHVLAPADATHGHSADNVGLIQGHALAPDDALHAQSADNLDLSFDAVLAVDDATHGQSADNVGLIEQEVLVVADAVHAQSADNVDLSQANVLAVDDATHDHSADSVTLSTAVQLVVADSLHGHTADNIGLLQAHVLAVDDATHAHSADSVVVDTGVILQVADALHAHGVDNVALVQQAVLAVASALHGHAAANITLQTETVLEVADAAHAHAADSPALTIGNVLEVADSIHLHAADTIELSQSSVLIVSDALHAHLADTLSLQLPGVLPPAGRVFVVRAKNTTYVVARGNRTFHA